MEARSSSTRSAISAWRHRPSCSRFSSNAPSAGWASTSVRRVDARVVAATNRDLAGMVAAHTLREDLFYRLNAITVHLPPLRERPRDIPALAAHFLAVSAREFGRRFASVAPETEGVLAAYRWPGNVRELRAVISRAALMHDDEQLRVSHLPPELVAAALSAPPARRIVRRRVRLQRFDPDARRR